MVETMTSDRIMKEIQMNSEIIGIAVSALMVLVANRMILYNHDNMKTGHIFFGPRDLLFKISAGHGFCCESSISDDPALWIQFFVLR